MYICDEHVYTETQPMSSHLTHMVVKVKKREGWVSWRRQQSHKSAKPQPPEPLPSDPLHGMGRGREDSDLQLLCWKL